MRVKLDRAVALMEQADFLEDQVSRASELRERLCGRELVISVIGHFKRGKSSLINPGKIADAGSTNHCRKNGRRR